MIPSVHHASRAGSGISAWCVFVRCLPIREALSPESAGRLPAQTESLGVSRIVGTLPPQSATAAHTILPRTDKHHALVEYALAGIDKQLFVSTYLLELPQKEEMQLFIDEQLREVGE